MKLSRISKIPFDNLFDPYKIPKCDYLLNNLKKISNKYKENYTLLAICPNSEAVIKASVVSAKKNNSPLLFAATLNQIDSDGGYTGLNFGQFTKKIHSEVKDKSYKGPVIIGIDHGGPWLKDKQSIENWGYKKCMKALKKSFEEALLTGYELIHVDPTVDRTLPQGEVMSIEVVVDRTVELISHIENFRRENNFPKISYEVGTEEVNGGLANINTFRKFLKLLKIKLENKRLEDIYPCFIVGKVGTDLHTKYFDKKVAQRLVFEADKYSSSIKGHYTDYVKNLSDYPKSGMGGVNIGPELTEVEFEILAELANIEKKLFTENKLKNISDVIKVVSKAVEKSGRWKKWLNEKEKFLKFNELSTKRRYWLIKTGARYIWANPEVVNARKILKSNLFRVNIDSEKIIISEIAKRIDKYFNAFNLIDLNSKLIKELKYNSLKFR